MATVRLCSEWLHIHEHRCSTSLSQWVIKEENINKGCGVVRETCRVSSRSCGEKVGSGYDQNKLYVCMKFSYKKQNIIKIKFKN